jgi:hypothetical protein
VPLNIGLRREIEEKVIWGMRWGTYMCSTFFVAQSGVGVGEVVDCMALMVVVVFEMLADFLFFAGVVAETFCC